MGGVRKRVENRQRSGSELTAVDLLWFLVNFVLFTVGLAVLWPSDGGRETVLWWALYSALWIVSVAGTEHLLARWRQRREAADRPRRRERAGVFAALLSVLLLVTHLKLNRYASERALYLIVVLAMLAIAVAVKVVARIRQRREAARRKQEVEDLAQQF